MYLLDTHTLIWSQFNSDNLSATAKEKLEDDNKVFVSIASFWEIAIKQSIGKLDIDISPKDLVDQCLESGMYLLPIKPEHLDLIKDLPDIHRDPFDRLLIAQAKSENLTFISRDEKIAQYDIDVVW
jgi:PIN domain nuclease of toxin-antitoxin system